MTWKNIPISNAKVTKVWVTQQKKGIANHWAVILEINNGIYYVNTQKEKGESLYLNYFYSLRAAVEASRRNEFRTTEVRLFFYGSCYKYWDMVYKKINSMKNENHFIIFQDCQNYARDIVSNITGKTVGFFPIENGPVYNNTIFTFDEVDDSINELSATGRLLLIILGVLGFFVIKGISSIFLG